MRKAERALVRAAAIAALVVASLAALPAYAATLPDRAAIATDRAATHAYLVAYDTYAQTVLGDIPSRLATVRGLAVAIAAECPGVLAHVPPSEMPGLRETPRERGEGNRRRQQLGELEQELSEALAPAALAPERQALAAFIATARSLRWSSQPLQSGVASFLDAFEQLTPPTQSPHVCADMHAWVASGYALLAPATKALINAASAPPLGLLRNAIPPTSPKLAPFEGPAERRLIAQLHEGRRQERSQIDQLEELLPAVERALGIRHPAEEFHFAPHHPTPGTVVIDRGRTHTGMRFTVTFEPATSEHPCTVEIAEGGGGAQTLAGSSPGRHCSFRSAHADGSVNCNQGQLTVQANTLPATHSVRLLLSDGSTITSPAIVIPARDGGPAGLYFQMVRGPSPIPVSLTELDRRGRTLRTDSLPKVVECTRHPLKYLPGGIRKLVRSRVPDGQRFTIEAQRYSFLGQVHLVLKAQVQEEQSGGFGVLFAASASGESRPLGVGGRLGPFAPEEATGCKPSPYMVVFGILTRPDDTVLARTPAGLVALHKQPLPASLHARGVLAWAAFSPPPTELVIRAPDGATVAHESIAERTRAQVEQCEGEAE